MNRSKYPAHPVNRRRTKKNHVYYDGLPACGSWAGKNMKVVSIGGRDIDTLGLVTGRDVSCERCLRIFYSNGDIKPIYKNDITIIL